jgi:transmembrane sensor
MEQWNIYDDLLVKYTLNECDEEEERFVSNWLNEAESHRIYYESLQKTLRLLEIKEASSKINIQQEWEHFNDLRKNNVLRLFDEQEHIDQEEQLPRYNHLGEYKKLWLVLATAVAASLIFLIIRPIDINRVDRAKSSGIANEQKGKPVNNNWLSAIILHEENTGDRLKIFHLPDGSVSRLYAASEITYTEPTGIKRREVILKGRADFKVAKDKAKPFTVFAGDISITALGTRFAVRSILTEKMIVVRLHEGEVVVRSNNKNAAPRMKEIHLLPGQELQYDIVTGKGVVRKFRARVPVKGAAQDSFITDNPIVPTYGKNSWFMFNNQPLNEIFDALAEMYHVKINYSGKDVNRMYHIGTYDKSDSLDYILKKITSFYDLSFEKGSNTYKIKKITARR